MHFWSQWTAFLVGHLPHFKRSSNLSKACLELFPLVSNANTDLCINIYLHIRSLQRTDAATWEIHLQASDVSPATGNWSASAIASLCPSLSFILSVWLSVSPNSVSAQLRSEPYAHLCFNFAGSSLSGLIARWCCRWCFYSNKLQITQVKPLSVFHIRFIIIPTRFFFHFQFSFAFFCWHIEDKHSLDCMHLYERKIDRMNGLNISFLPV